MPIWRRMESFTCPNERPIFRGRPHGNKRVRLKDSTTFRQPAGLYLISTHRSPLSIRKLDPVVLLGTFLARFLLEEATPILHAASVFRVPQKEVRHRW